jgi:hypothetical protein
MAMLRYWAQRGSSVCSPYLKNVLGWGKRYMSKTWHKLALAADNSSSLNRT